MKVLCWNINSLEPTRRNAILKFGSYKAMFEEYGADIACFQETKLRDEKLTKELCCVEGYQSFWAISREKKGYSGVVTYVSTAYAPLSCQIDSLGSGEDDIDREGRVVLTDHSAFVLVNVYVPNAGDPPERARLGIKLKFLRALKERCDALVAEGREVLIVGDLNIAAAPQDVHPTFDYSSLYAPEERGALMAFLEDGYTDVWRRLHPGASDVYTVWDEYTGARAFNRGLRIDYFLATPGLLDKVVSCEMVPTPPKWSDHTGMILELRDIEPLPPHPPCPQWAKLLRRFQDATQPSVAAFFGRKKEKQQLQENPPGNSSGTTAATAKGPAGPVFAPASAAAAGTAAGVEAVAAAAGAPASAGAVAGAAAAGTSSAPQTDGCLAGDEGAGNGAGTVDRKAAGKQPQRSRPPAADPPSREAGGEVAAGRKGPAGTAAASAPAGEQLAGGPDQQQQEEGQSNEAPSGSKKGGTVAVAANAGAGSGSGNGRKRKAALLAAGGGKRGGKGGRSKGGDASGGRGGNGGQRSIASFLRPASQE